MNIAVVGDIGTTINSRDNINTMTARHAVNPYSFLIHAGDLSYANDNQTIWDTFGNVIQPLAAQIPYMVAPGNHELISMFIPYQKRFVMPAEASGSDAGSLYYSFNYQLAHVIALNSEAQLYGHTLNQYKWLAADLAKVDRSVTPWVFVFFHSPWYSSNTVHENSGESMRVSYEALFNSAKVDMVLNGHVHAYERTYSVNNNQLDPAAPEYRTCGNGGNHEGLYNTWIEPKPAWSAYRNAFYGFSSMEIYNATHLYWEAFRVSNNTVADSSWLIRQR
jgi:3',5'-cyclic AMP phosphodiesterase CpdA